MERLFTYKIDHFLFWLLTVGFHAYTHSGLITQAGFGQFALELVVRNGLLAVVIYSNLLIAIPILNSQQRIGKALVTILVTVMLYIILKNLHDVYLYGHVMDNPARQEFFHNTFYNFSIVLFYLAFASTLYLSKQWYIQKELIRKIELEKLNTELEYLKAQINPHFLFNSLNTVFFQIDKQNTSARETLSKFSDMLRYQLYECNGKEIAVEKEIRYLKNYVALQRLRKDEHYDIRFSCAEGLKNFTLPPLLLLPFIENAFKHVSHFSDKKNIIDIDISKTGDFFQLKIFNTKDSRQVSTHSGIGLKNVQRRLELLYTERYKLNIIDHPESFNVQLNLKVM
ncbi:MAG: sensor histidine kinase [Cyclobacteriaceae bacterium]|nr:sensor histidine kinase [Cyclobacteriaceae bacterium]